MPKAQRLWGVFPHAVNKQITGRGYVVRELDADGIVRDWFNYGTVTKVATYRQEKAADRCAERYNRDAIEGGTR